MYIIVFFIKMDVSFDRIMGIPGAGKAIELSKLESK
jgi:hypothetical protein